MSRYVGSIRELMDQTSIVTFNQRFAFAYANFFAMVVGSQSLGRIYKVLCVNVEEERIQRMFFRRHNLFWVFLPMVGVKL